MKHETWHDVEYLQILLHLPNKEKRDNTRKEDQDNQIEARAKIAEMTVPAMSGMLCNLGWEC